MLERTSVGALGIVVGVLCLSSLARLRDAEPRRPQAQPQPATAPAVAAAPPQMPPRPPRDEPQPDAVRALREGQQLDLNSAQVGDLELLPGIGPKLARRIVDDRRDHGLYRRVDQLRRVRGVGPRTLARLRPLLRVEPSGGVGHRPASMIEHEDHRRRDGEVPRIPPQSAQQQARPQVELERHAP